MRLYLIRHGQTPSNVIAALDTAAPGPGLTPEGVRQADAMATAFAGVSLDRVYASSLRRAQLTAGPLARARGPLFKGVLHDKYLYRKYALAIGRNHVDVFGSRRTAAPPLLHFVKIVLIHIAAGGGVAFYPADGFRTRHG